MIHDVKYCGRIFLSFVSKWPKWLSQTLYPFSQILKILSGIQAPIVAPSSDDFQICYIHWKVFFFPEKTLQTPSKSAYKCWRYLLLNNATASLAPLRGYHDLLHIQTLKSEKHHTLYSHADVCRSISTKFCMMMVCAIISPLKHFFGSHQ